MSHKKPQDEHAILLTLLSTKGLSARGLRTLRENFASWEDLLNASPDDLITSGVRRNYITALATAQRAFGECDSAAILAPYCDAGVEIVTIEDEAYPPLLREIADAPLILFVRGTLQSLIEKPSVTIVGSREHTAYGERATYSLAHDLARAGVTVISGLARGIDAIAHRGALDAGGSTIGILGGSVDDAHIAPRQNQRLAHAMLERGAIVSEYPLFTQPTAYTFPARNRIMAAMAHVTLVIEAAQKSGTLITAHHAIEYGRDVCAVPGDIFSPVSTGTNTLIRSGAKIVTCVQDILEELPIARATHAAEQPLTQTPSYNLSADEESVFALLSQEALHVDKIAAMSKLETTRVLSALSLLEIKGIVRNIGGTRYVRTVTQK